MNETAVWQIQLIKKATSESALVGYHLLFLICWVVSLLSGLFSFAYVICSIICFIVLGQGLRKGLFKSCARASRGSISERDR